MESQDDAPSKELARSLAMKHHFRLLEAIQRGEHTHSVTEKDEEDLDELKAKWTEDQYYQFYEWYGEEHSALHNSWMADQEKLGAAVQVELRESEANMIAAEKELDEATKEFQSRKKWAPVYFLGIVIGLVISIWFVVNS